jgi:hypothetical protein
MRKLASLVILLACGCGDGLRVQFLARTADGGAGSSLARYSPRGLDEHGGAVIEQRQLWVDAAGRTVANQTHSVQSCKDVAVACVEAGGDADTSWRLSDGSTIAVDLDRARLSRTDGAGHAVWSTAIGKVQMMDLLDSEPLFDDALFFTGLVGDHEWLVKMSTVSGATDWSVDLTANAR